MLAIDTINGEPKTEYELETRRQNRWASDLAQLNRHRVKIEIKEFYNCAQCGVETDYWKFGEICGRCEALSELRMA